MKVGIYDPYLNTLGGGERYVLNMANCLADSHKVDIFWDNDIASEIKKKFSIDLQGVSFTENIFSKNYPFFKKLNKTRQYDIIIFVSDGSIPLLLSRKNFLILQYPVSWINPKSIMNRLKLSKIKAIICYSEFVKSYIDQSFPKECIVIPPTYDIKPQKINQENLILTVGRFTKALNNKKHEVLVEVFKDMIDKGLKDWKLVIAGSVLENDRDLVDKIKKLSKGYPIEVVDNPDYDTLNKMYSKSKIYWHAAGFGEDLDKFPERAEHFGISTVEAMASGSVPVVINAGGQKEIVEEGISGFLWDTRDQLSEITTKLIYNEDLLKGIALRAQEKAKDFDYSVFCRKVTNLV